jgi:hypothetical protein
MPNPTIDLQRDCELWCDFDTDYFDSQRNKILDRSGNGRNPEASGGPTLGANGPDNFEAASFDGSDDLFDTGYKNDFAITDDWSIFVNAKARSGATAASSALLLSGSFSGSLGIQIDDSGRLEAGVRDKSNNSLITDSIFVETDEFFSAVARFDASQNKLTVRVDNGDVTSESLSGGFTDQLGSATWKIGNPGSVSGGSKFFDGEMASCALWQRNLTDAEIDSLFRLTEPRRAQL